MNSAVNNAMTKEEWIKEIEEQTLLELAEFGISIDTTYYDDGASVPVERDYKLQCYISVPLTDPLTGPVRTQRYVRS